MQEIRRSDERGYADHGWLKSFDSTGTNSVIRVGDVQRMSAGSGVRHSEFNNSKNQPVHFLQIWILPNALGIAPGYEQKHFAPQEKKRGQLRLLASENGADGSVQIHQDARLYAGLFNGDEGATLELGQHRRVYFRVVRGAIAANTHALAAGDGLKLTDVASMGLIEGVDAEVIVFDLAADRP